MNKDMEKKQLNVLEKMERIFKDGAFAATLKRKGEDDLPTDVLMVMDMGVGADSSELPFEFFFYGNTTDDTVSYFNIMSTIETDILKENLPNIYKYLCVLNYTLPIGAYGVDETGEGIVLKYTLPLTGSLTEDQLFAEINIAITNIMELAEKQVDIVRKIADGRINDDTVSEFVDFLTE